MTTRIKDTYWSPGERDDEGHRTYNLTTLIQSDTDDDGPVRVLLTPGLPQPGDEWNFGNDLDVWAFCRQGAKIKTHESKKEDTHRWFEVEQTFTTKPDDKRCKDQQIDDPLLTPDRVSGGFNKFQEEYAEDRFDTPLRNSSYEQLKGPQAEFDRSRDHVKIEQNVPDLQLSLVTAMKDHVNLLPMWGLPSRCIKMTSFTWSKKYYGRCSYYYERSFEFEIRVKKIKGIAVTGTGAQDKLVSGWDRDVLDQGTRVLKGKWHDIFDIWIPFKNPGSDPIDPQNPSSYMHAIDRAGNKITVVLDGHGMPATKLIENGPQVTVLADVGFAAGDHTLFDGSIVFAKRVALLIDITDPDNAVTEGYLIIQGEDDHGNQLDENFDLSIGETLSYKSANKYLKVTKIQVSNIHWTGSSGPSVKVTTTDPILNTGKIHIEAYDEADFSLLNIPIFF